MNKFLLDLWHDLRRKHLLPVALLLVGALIAVPVFMKKSSHPAQPAPATGSAASSSTADTKPLVVAASDSSASKLQAFSSKDPFKPHLPATKAASAGTTGASGATGGSGSGSGSGSGGDTSGGGGAGGTGGGSNGGTTTPKGPFAYVVSVKFGERDHTKTYHQVEKLDVLPNANHPLLVFMGVNTAGDTAVFLTDTSLKASGEGDCKPSADVCSFLYLKLDKNSDTEDLLAQNADGTGIEYTLKLLDIKKVPVSELEAASASAKDSKRAAAEAKRLRNKPGTPFHLLFKLPLLPDEVDG
ncbi:MAG TPA: hypothetical protein VN606_02725 [Thermoleophilaceae bacterium]|nr:hypothetical protein [Thermoleophilaceae bacterium]